MRIKCPLCNKRLDMMFECEDAYCAQFVCGTAINSEGEIVPGDKCNKEQGRDPEKERG